MLHAVLCARIECVYERTKSHSLLTRPIASAFHTRNGKMSAEELQTVTTGQPHLAKQDLSQLVRILFSFDALNFINT